MLVRLNRLKASAIRSSLRRSPSETRRPSRISQVKNPEVLKRLRPRLPVQPSGGVTPGTMVVKGLPPLSTQTFAGPKVAPGMNGDWALPPTDGRSWEALRSRRVSPATMMLKGRPEETSTMGERLKSPIRYLKKPSPDLAEGLWKTALVTQRWR